jgi:hypothetical protein
MNEVIETLQKWQVEANSGHNDGWTQKHYQDKIDEVRIMMEEGPISHNGRMVDKDNIDKGLRALSGWLSDKGYEELGSNDYNYYQEVIGAARDRLAED